MSRRRLAGAILIVCAAFAVLAGGVVAVGGDDPASETGRLERRALVAVLFFAFGCLSMAAGLRLRRNERGGTLLAAVATCVIAATAAFRLWRFGAVGIGQLILVAALAALLWTPREGPRREPTR